MYISCLNKIKFVPHYISRRVRACTMSEIHTFNWSKPEEIKIELPNGVIAGKWWGPQSVRPILCIHGWQDNAGSFDAIIPLLPKHLSYLAIDLPGHGYSFRYPTGIVYNFTDMVFLIKLIVDIYKWKKVSIISHSMSVLGSYLYAGLAPDEVDFLISLDIVKPPEMPVKYLVENYMSQLQNYVKLEKQSMSDIKPLSYSYEETIERLVKGSMESITKEAAPYLLKRGIAQTKLDPTKYYFTYDNRVKLAVHKMAQNEFLLQLAQNIRAPYLCIKANSQNPFFLESIDNFNEAMTILKKSNPNFEFHSVEGSHHVHLTEPEKISRILSEFICRLRPINSETEDVNKNNYVDCKL